MSKESYQANLIDKIESLANVWDGEHFTISTKRNAIIISRKLLVLNQGNILVYISDLILFEKDLSDMLTSLQFRDVKDSLQY